jgi:hypothetical protein
MTAPDAGLVRSLFDAAVAAASPDDPTGHLPNCGYNDEDQTCGCAEYGKRLYAALAAALAEAGIGPVAQARAEAWDEAVATVRRQTNLADLIHFDRPSDFRKGVLTCITALEAARAAAAEIRGES